MRRWPLASAATMTEARGELPASRHDSAHMHATIRLDYIEDISASRAHGAAEGTFYCALEAFSLGLAPRFIACRLDADRQRRLFQPPGRTASAPTRRAHDTQQRALMRLRWLFDFRQQKSIGSPSARAIEHFLTMPNMRRLLTAR